MTNVLPIAQLLTLADELLAVEEHTLAVSMLTNTNNVLFSLTNSLQSTNEQQKVIAAWLLGKLGDKRAYRILLETFLSRGLKKKVRQQMALALSELGSRRPVQQLISRMLEDEEDFVREYSAYILGWLFDQRAVFPLVKVLQREEEIVAVRAQACESLGHLRVPEAKQAVPALRLALRDKSPQIRFWSVFALAELGDEASIPDLQLLTADTAELPRWGTISEEANEAIALIQERAKQLTENEK